MGWLVLVVAILLILAALDLLFGKRFYAMLRGDNIDPEAHAALRASRSHLRDYVDPK